VDANHLQRLLLSLRKKRKKRTLSRLEAPIVLLHFRRDSESHPCISAFSSGGYTQLYSGTKGTDGQVNGTEACRSPSAASKHLSFWMVKKILLYKAMSRIVSSTLSGPHPHYRDYSSNDTPYMTFAYDIKDPRQERAAGLRVEMGPQNKPDG